MNSHEVILVYENWLSDKGKYIAENFSADVVESVDSALERVEAHELKILVIDTVLSLEFNLDFFRSLLQAASIEHVPVITLVSSCELAQKLTAYDLGVDDFIDASVGGDEACLRIKRSMYNHIAHEHLKSRLELANQTAHTAMSDCSDLGANIQFLLAVHDCDNLDQLGQQLFSTLRRYGLHCSLQMRSALGEKNMEAHGMAKDLESQLLAQLCDSGRFIDFGSRTVINYDRVSLLIKNMPLNDAVKYGAIKDNIFSLLQGVNARIIALEDKERLLEEKEALRKISNDVGLVMDSLKASYQKVMCDIVYEVENVAELIQTKVPSLALNEEQESFLERAAEQAIVETNRIFNEGLVVDEIFARLESVIECSLKNAGPARNTETEMHSRLDISGDDPVELF